MDAGILPIKDPTHAKRRLAAAFDDPTRVAIAQALADDAIGLVSRVDSVLWWVVSDSEAILNKARENGHRTIRDDGTDLNAALRLAIGAASAGGASAICMIPGDAPLATEEDVLDLIDTGATSDVVVVPSGSDGGTNGLFMRPPDLLDPHFGPSSLQAHIGAAEAAGHRCAVLARDRLALDLDTPEDIEELLKHDTQRPSATVELLRSLRA